MSDLQNYINKRKEQDADFAMEYDVGYENFKIGAMLKNTRMAEGITQAEMAKRLDTQKPAISRIENHAEDIRFSTITKYIMALGKNIKLVIE